MPGPIQPGVTYRGYVEVENIGPCECCGPDVGDCDCSCELPDELGISFKNTQCVHEKESRSETLTTCTILYEEPSVFDCYEDPILIYSTQLFCEPGNKWRLTVNGEDTDRFHQYQASIYLPSGSCPVPGTYDVEITQDEEDPHYPLVVSVTIPG